MILSHSARRRENLHEAGVGRPRGIRGVASASELMREAFRAWQQRDEKQQGELAATRKHLQDAVDDPRPNVSVEDAFERLRAHHLASKIQRAS